MKVCVMLFPGMNCERETVAALQSVGLDAEIRRSNEPALVLDAYDGYVLPGGFSYEDRIRAGVLAAWERAMETVARAARAGKPVAGICNGAQVLLEAGLVPGLRPGQVEMGLALNDSGSRVGYYCDWRWVVGDLFPEPVPLPFAHAEGRFVTDDQETRERVLALGLVTARYCTREGTVEPGWPVNPNGAWENAAAIRGASGHVVAIMPHPERANWAWQVPREMGGRRSGTGAEDPEWRERPGPGRRFFESFSDLLAGAVA